MTSALSPGPLRMPAEWEPHDATWIGWPHNKTDWPGKFHPIPWVYAEIARKIAPCETLRILVNSQALRARAEAVLKRTGVGLDRVEFLLIPTNRGWTRDFGPIFVQESLPGGASRNVIVRFRFNAWAKYRDGQLDAEVPRRAAEALGTPLVEARAQGKAFVLEGGAVDVNGSGAVLTTEECLLDRERQARNPHLSRKEVEEALSAYLGAKQVLWLGRGIAGDDTHGHVDDVCRFAGSRTVLLCQETDPNDANYAPLQENRERLEGMRLEDGSKVQIVPLPMPAPLYFDGQRLPASYANFYVSNAAVLAPVFNDPMDRRALGILSEVFRDRPVVGINAVDLVWGLGTLHCLTQQQPVQPSHEALRIGRGA